MIAPLSSQKQASPPCTPEAKGSERGRLLKSGARPCHDMCIYRYICILHVYIHIYIHTYAQAFAAAHLGPPTTSHFLSGCQGLEIGGCADQGPQAARSSCPFWLAVQEVEFSHHNMDT